MDGRYDWLPSPYTLKAKYPRSEIVDFDDGCQHETMDVVNLTSKIALVSRDGKCSYYEKVRVIWTTVLIGVSSLIDYTWTHLRLESAASIVDKKSSPV